MKINWNVIKMTIVTSSAILLYSFANKRNSKRVVHREIDVEFIGENDIFIDQDAVSKLLIQTNESMMSEAKEKLALNMLEHTLNTDKTIHKAHVYVTIGGQLKAKVRQKVPIARINGTPSFYIDSYGDMMPLSSSFSARVPLISGIKNKEKLSSTYTLAHYIYNDEFLKKNVVGIHQYENDFDLYFRMEDFVVKIGDANRLDAKFNNFKAFYQKACKDNILHKYSTVNLAFNNQIVCTKK